MNGSVVEVGRELFNLLCEGDSDQYRSDAYSLVHRITTEDCKDIIVALQYRTSFEVALEFAAKYRGTNIEQLVPLSPTEAKYLDWIMHRIRCYKKCPGYTELTHYFEVSRPYMVTQMHSLVSKGYLKVAGGNNHKHTWVPLVGINWHAKMAGGVI